MDSPLRRTVLVLNAVSAVFFAVFFGYTFFARGHLDGLARDYVTAKTEQYAAPAVDLAEKAVDSKLAKIALGDERLARIHEEIAEYRRDPASYIATLTGKHMPDEPKAGDNALVAKVAGWKRKVREYYDATLDDLVVDLRIFAGSNLMACMAAIAIIAVARSDRVGHFAWFSFLMFVAVVFCSYMYVDGLNFFSILTRSHLGWWYPVFLAVAVVWLYLDYVRRATDIRIISDAVAGD